MCLSGWYVENVLYSFFIIAGRDIMDSTNIRSKNEWLYECNIVSNSYRIKYAQYSTAAIDCQFMYFTANCQDCFMCAGVRGKRYFFKNVQYTKEEYEKILADYRLDTWSGVERAKKEYAEFLSKNLKRRYAHILHSVNCTGDTISFSKNCKQCFVTKKSENVRYSDFTNGNKDSSDVTMTGEVSECYEGAVVDHSQLNFFGVFSVKSQDLRYTQHCHSSKHLFGCVGLKSAKYCIFNKEYTKEEYEKLVPKIIEQMNKMPYIDNVGNSYAYGEFYPIELSPFGYNETNAPEVTPLTKEEALKNGYNWQDDIQKTLGKETLKPDDIPDSINNVDDSILNEVLSCIECERNYKIVPSELIFYRKMNIPIARKCFFCRHGERIKNRKQFKLWHRSCMCKQNDHSHGEGECKIEFETPYNPDGPELIYCEKCYQAEVY